MPHVSRHKLDPKLRNKILAKFIKILISAKDSRSLTLILDELLTSTEKVMLAKRLAVIAMVSSDIPHERISQVLKLSPTTVAKLSLGVEVGKYKTIVKLSGKEKIDLEKIIWLLLTAGGIMPPRADRKYWRKYELR
jgi:uncharacterized protein YerC